MFLNFVQKEVSELMYQIILQLTRLYLINFVNLFFKKKVFVFICLFEYILNQYCVKNLSEYWFLFIYILTQDLYHMSARNQVVDITHRKPGIVPAVDKATPKHQLVEKTARLYDANNNLIKVRQILVPTKLGVVDCIQWVSVIYVYTFWSVSMNVSFTVILLHFCKIWS